MGEPRLVGGAYVEEPGREGKPIAWWFYEDHKYSVKRLIAAAGYPADEISMAGVSMDEMRPGCWKPKDRLADMDLNSVEAQMCFPNYLDSAGRSSCGPRTRNSRCSASRPTTTGWSRVGRPEGGTADPAVPGAALGSAAGGRRGAAQRGPRGPRRRASASCRPTWGCPASTAATGTRCSPPATRPAR